MIRSGDIISVTKKPSYSLPTPSEAYHRNQARLLRAELRRRPWRRMFEAEICPDGHLRVRRNTSVGGVMSNVPWRTLQIIKNDMLGPEVTCVEIFPAESDMVDEADYRHLWPVMKSLLPGWEFDADSVSGRRKRNPEWLQHM